MQRRARIIRRRAGQCEKDPGEASRIPGSLCRGPRSLFGKAIVKRELGNAHSPRFGPYYSGRQVCRQGVGSLAWPSGLAVCAGSNGGTPGPVSRRKKRKKRWRRERPAAPSQAKSSQPKPEEAPRPTAKTVEQVDAALAAARWRRAWALAKPLLERPDITPGQRDTILAALAGRTREMLDSGHAEQAVAMAHAAETTRPEWKDAWPLNFRLLVECAAGTDDLLHGYLESPELAAEIDECVRRDGIFLELLSRHPQLDDLHPLVGQARTILAAWREIEDGEAGPARDVLRGIPRRSPFSCWRLFLQALRAYYEGKDEHGRACLERVPADSAPAHLAGILADLYKGRCPDTRQGREIWRKSTAGNDWREQLEELESKWMTMAPNRVIRQVDAVTAAFVRRGNLSLALDLLAWLLWRSFEDDRSLSFRRLPLYRNRRCQALARAEQLMGADDEETWLDCIQSASGKTNPTEKALIFARIAELQIKEFRDLRGDDDLLLDMDERADIDETFTQATAASPVAEIFRQWYEFRVSMNAPVQPILEKWSDHHPEDTTPLYLLAESARAGEDFGAAVHAFDRLRTIEGRSPRLDALAPVIHLGQALRSFEEGDNEAAETALALVDGGNPCIEISKSCVRSLGAVRDRRAKVAAGKQLGTARRPYLVWHCFSRLRSGFPKVSLPASVKRQLADPDLTVLSFVDLFSIDDEGWKARGLDWPADLEQALRSTSVDTAALLDCITGLWRLDPGLEEVHIRTAIMAGTVTGLKRDDELLGMFLAHRALVHDGHSRCISVFGFPGERDNEQARECLMAATRVVAERGGDEAFLNTIGDTIAFQEFREAAENLGKQQIKRILRKEKQIKELDIVHPFRFPFPRSTLGRPYESDSGDGTDPFPYSALQELIERLAGLADLPDDDHEAPFPDPGPPPVPRSRGCGRKPTRRGPTDDRQLEFPEFF